MKIHATLNKRNFFYHVRQKEIKKRKAIMEEKKQCEARHHNNESLPSLR